MLLAKGSGKRRITTRPSRPASPAIRSRAMFMDPGPVRRMRRAVANCCRFGHISAMPHLILLGDSILDNQAYTAGGPAVIAQVTKRLPLGWQASLNAIDGSTTDDIPAQLASLPVDATHLLLSVGGNNALLRAEILDTPVLSSGEALRLLSEVAGEFEVAYRSVVDACLARKLPLVVCTIYNGNFPDPNYQQRVGVALTVFNDVILRVATENDLTVIDLRLVCSSAADYANPIEPSSVGGEKIAGAIVGAVTAPAGTTRGARVIAG